MSKDIFRDGNKDITLETECTLKDFLKGWSKPSTYTTFWDRFAHLVEPKIMFGTKMKTATKDSELLCSSSEAFALLLLENHWERWIDLYIISKGEIFQRGKSVLGDYETDIPPKYTRGGSKTVRGIGKGWTKEGIERFNELYLMVKGL